MAQLIHGSDYNPEQWLDRPDIIDGDIRLMKKAGMNSMSIGIFSWSVLEPEEGKYDFSFLDMIMEKFYQNDIKAILATPSGARPRWLAEKYPEVLRTDSLGRKQVFGGRHNHCHSSPIFREKITAINTLLAKRYKDHPSLFMWHISNELSGGCFCPRCRKAFIDYLKKQYNNDLDKLNHDWWTTFWSHTYTNWEQIEPPSPLGDTNLHGLNLAWNRFITHLCADYIKTEVAPLKEITPNIPTTINMMDMFTGLDYEVLKDEVDIISWDNYPHWHSENDYDAAIKADFAHDWFRSLKHKPFFMMESTPSLVNWQGYNRPKRPGMHILSSLAAVAHGSDSVQYFQWRKSRGSSEKFHGAVIDHCGRDDTRVFKEVSELGKILQSISDVAGTQIKSEVAIIYDTQNRWALDDAQALCNKDKQYFAQVLDHYRALRKLGVNIDVIGSCQDFSSYKLICAPMLYMISEQNANRLKDFVKNGGVLVSGYFSAVVNENDLCYLGGCPGGGLGEVFGVWAEEIDTLLPGNTVSVADEQNTYTAADFCEVIHPTTAKTLLKYTQEFYQGTPAACVNSYHNGKAYYIAYRDSGKFYDVLYDNITTELGICREKSVLPYGLLIQKRGGLTFVGNYSENYIDFIIPDGSYDIVSGSQGRLSLQPYGVLAITKKE